MQIGDTCYFCNVIPKCGIYECEELKIRTVADRYYVGVNIKTKQAIVFTEDMIDTYVFVHRIDAVQALREYEEKKNGHGNIAQVQGQEAEV